MKPNKTRFVQISPWREWLIITLILGTFAVIVFRGGMQFSQTWSISGGISKLISEMAGKPSAPSLA